MLITFKSSNLSFENDLRSITQLENILLEQVRKLGVGIYPNEKVDCLDVIDRIAIAVKKWRATGTTHPIAINDIIKITKLISDYGILNDHFPINEAIYITDLEQISGLKRKLDLVKKLAKFSCQYAFQLLYHLTQYSN